MIPHITKEMINWLSSKASPDRRSTITLYKDGQLVDEIQMLSKHLKLGNFGVLCKAIDILRKKNNVPEEENVLPIEFCQTGYTFSINEKGCK